MSDQQHTKEPWAVCEKHSYRILDADQRPTAAALGGGHEKPFTLEEIKANARRIVACVNVCHGLREDELTGGVVPAPNLIRIREKLDELLADIKAAMDSLLESEGASWAYDIAQINYAIREAEAAA
jgi:hypothetical protein